MKSLITGISGQDGRILAQLLLDKEIEVYGLTQDASSTENELNPCFGNDIEIIEFDYTKPENFRQIFSRIQPDYIFNFAAKSSGSGMFDAPQEMFSLNANFPLMILETLREFVNQKKSTFVQASSREMFGNPGLENVTEETPLRPLSPYGAAKAYVHHMIGIYRKLHGLRCCSAIMFNHESIHRSEQFITRKIVNASVKIKLGLQDTLELGDLSIQRDWGHAADFMNGLYLIATNDEANDYVMATGKLSKIADVVDIAFSHLDLDSKQYIRINEKFLRKIDTPAFSADTGKIFRDLGWTHRTNLKQTIIEMVNHEMQVQSSSKHR